MTKIIRGSTICIERLKDISEPTSDRAGLVHAVQAKWEPVTLGQIS
jgi:hypothetical protein